MEGHPVNDGGICIRGLSGLQLLYGPTRVKSPLKRVGKRGEGKWEKISWEAAIGEVAQALGKIRSEGQPHSVAAVMGSDRGTVSQLMQRLLTVYGSPNFFRMPSVQDAYEQALFLMQGQRAMAGFDLENTDFVLSFGSGLIEGWGAPVRSIQASSRWEQSGVRVVQVEPRLSNTAARAAKSGDWVPVRPGTEAALAMGMAHVIIKENRYRELIDHATSGFESVVDPEGQKHTGFKEMVLESYSPETVSGITGIPAERIAALAREFSAAKRPLALAGRGAGRTPGSVYDIMAVQALNILVGSINAEGGIWSVPEPGYIEWPVPEMDRAAATGIQNGRIDGAGSDSAPYSRYLLHRLPKAVSGENGYPLRALLVSEANPAYGLPDTRAFQQALDAVELVVSFSSYMDETAMQADLILPNHVYLERVEDIPAPAGFPRPLIGLSRPVVDPQFDTRHVGDVILGIAREMGGTIADAFPWSGYEACLRATLGSRWAAMARNGYWQKKGYAPEPATNGFDTESGKFEFLSTALREYHTDSGAMMPRYQAIVPEGDAAGFPLVLMPYETLRLSSDYVGSPPFMMKAAGGTVLEGDTGVVEVNPETAASLGLGDGDGAVVETPVGRAEVRVHLNAGAPPDAVFMPRGLGHTAYDDYLAGKGANINSLMGPVEDPVSGLDAAWGIRASLTKV
jgi:anaerobic selenocysteine-containing dehydrogenase